MHQGTHFPTIAVSFSGGHMDEQALKADGMFHTESLAFGRLRQEDHHT